MSQRQKSVKVPIDLLDAVKVYHKQRSAYADAMLLIQETYEREVTRLKDEHVEQTVDLVNRFITAGVVKKGEQFNLNTEFLEEHGDAFIIFTGPLVVAAPESKTVH